MAGKRSTKMRPQQKAGERWRAGNKESEGNTRKQKVCELQNREKQRSWGSDLGETTEKTKDMMVGLGKGVPCVRF